MDLLVTLMYCKRPSKEVLTDLYLTRKLSQPAIARVLNVAERSVRNWMILYGIKARDAKGANNSNYRDGRHCGATVYKRQRKRRCTLCGTTKDLGVHHKNDDHYDNRPENLETLCNSCHMSETKRKWWAAKKAGLPTPKSNGPVGWTKGREAD